MRNWITAVLMTGLLAGCAQTQIQDPASIWYRMPVGTVLVLEQPLVIEPNHTRVFLQFGRVVRQGDLDRYYPSCNFEVRERRPAAQTIAPDRFTVVRVEQGWEHAISALEWKRVGQFTNDGPAEINRSLWHWLSSGRQPNVMRLACHGGYTDLQRAELPTLQEIRQALGDKVEIYL